MTRHIWLAGALAFGLAPWIAAQAPIPGPIVAVPPAGVVNGIIKGDGAGNVAAAVAGTDYPGLPTVVSTPGDMACAHAADTTINQLTVTAATNAAPIVFTVSTSPITAGYYVGLPVTASASNPAAYDSAAYHVTALDATHVTVDNGGAPGAGWTSSTKLSMTCGNALTDAAGSSTYSFAAATLPASTFAQGTNVSVKAQTALFTASSNVPTVNALKLAYAGSAIYTAAGLLVSSASAAGYGGLWEWGLTGLSPTLLVTEAGSLAGWFTSNNSLYANSLKQPVVIATSSATVGVQFSFLATGIGASTCNDAGNKCGIATVTGTVGQTCNLTAFNGAGGSAATATVALTGTNVIANGTPIVITNTGSGYTGTSTAATAGAGTATCTGTAALTMAALGGAQGNALVQLGLVVRKN